MQKNGLRKMQNDEGYWEIFDSLPVELRNVLNYAPRKKPDFNTLQMIINLAIEFNEPIIKTMHRIKSTKIDIGLNDWPKGD